MIKRVEGFDIYNNQEKANIVLTNEINAIHNDIWVCLYGNRSTLKIDQQTKDALNSLYRCLTNLKKDGLI